MKPGGRALAVAALAVLGAGCVGPARRWTPTTGRVAPFAGWPTEVPVVGLGAKVSPRGLIAKRCLSEARSSTATGTFLVEVRPVDGPLRSGDDGADAFVEGAARRAERARPRRGGPPAVAALLTVRATGQWTSLQEGSAVFFEHLNRLLLERQAWDFFERCGTHYVHAVRREPSALVYVALYPADEAQRTRWAERIARRAGNAPDDLVTLGVLDQLVEGAPSFLAIRADADEAFEVVELGRGSGRGAGKLVGNALRAGFGADRGRIAEVDLQPWSSLQAASDLLEDPRDPLDNEPERRERLFNRLKLLEGRALDRETLLSQVKEVNGAHRCAAALDRSLSTFSWDAFYRCRDAARDALPESLEAVEVCRPVLAALDPDLPDPCDRPLYDEGRFADPRKRSDTRAPLLVAWGAGPDAHLDEDALPFEQPAEVGAQTDRWGNRFPGSCLRSSGGPSAPPERGPVPRPWSQDEWDALPEDGAPPAAASPGGEAPGEARPKEEEEKPLCIESPGGGGDPLCLQPKGAGPSAPNGADASAPPEPTPGGFAGGAPSPVPEKPAAPGPGAGEPPEVILGVSANQRPHGVRQWPWWKRFVNPWLLFRKAPEPRPIERGAYELRTLAEDSAGDLRLTDEAAALARKDLPAFYRTCGTHRVRQVLGRKGIAYYFTRESPGDLEISVLPYGVSRQTAESAALHPAQVQEFLTGRPKWLKVLSARSAVAVPERLVLEPWSELLLEAGVVQPHQLSPRAAAP